jgi:rhodanese-related sulfurtransferase
MMGGGQESGQRSGTENMSGIAALGAVLAALEEGTTFASHVQLMDFRDRLAGALRLAFPAVVFNTPFQHALPTTLNFSVPGMAGKELLDLFDAAGIRVSSGSACSAAKAAPSYVLEAMGLPEWRSGAAVRLSFGPMVDARFIDAACARILRCGDALRTAAPAAIVAAPALEPSGALPAFTLAPEALAEFLLAHPDACLIDVREAVEHAVAGEHLWHGRRADNVPLARVPQQAAEWLRGARQPLVFFCRSGNRSAQAAAHMHRLGYHNAWHLAGGMALASV